MVTPVNVNRKRSNRFLDMTGLVFGRLTVLQLAGINNRKHAEWECQCDCGNRGVFVGYRLREGKTRSCGCLQIDSRLIAPTLHGHARQQKMTPEYRAWCAARKRCNNPRCDKFKYYGGRGIECRFEAFLDFLAEVGPRPSPKHSIDRINVDGHYEKGNIRWATPKEQRANRRPAA